MDAGRPPWQAPAAELAVVLMGPRKALDSQQGHPHGLGIMGMFSNLMSKVFGKKTEVTPAVAAAPAAETPAETVTQPDDSGFEKITAPDGASGAGDDVTYPVEDAPVEEVDVVATLDAMAAESDEDLDWKRSIVDLLKLVGMDSSLAARKELAADLDYDGDTHDSASMNIWLHQEVLTRFAQNGGNIPPELMH